MKETVSDEAHEDQWGVRSIDICGPVVKTVGVSYGPRGYTAVSLITACYLLCARTYDVVQMNYLHPTPFIDFFN